MVSLNFLENVMTEEAMAKEVLLKKVEKD